MEARISIPKYLYWAIFGIVCFCFCFMIAVYPIANDDWWALSEVKEGGYWECFKFHSKYDNVRIGNYFGIIMVNGPRWLALTLSCICFIAVFWLMTKVCNIKSPKWKAITLLAFLLWIAIPWDLSLFCQMYIYNYLFSDLLFLTLFLLYIKSEGSILLSVIIALFLGMWHEGYAIAFASGIIFELIIKRKKLTKHRLIIFICVLLGIIYFFSFPVLFSKAHVHRISVDKIAKLAYCWIYFVFLAFWFFLLINKQYRELAKSTLSLFTAASGVLIPLVILTGFSRALMPGMILSCCSVTVYIIETTKRLSISSKTITVIVILIFTTTSMATACYQAIILHNNINFKNEAFRQAVGKNSNIFGPVQFPWEAPTIALFRPDSEMMFVISGNYYFLSTIYNKDVYIVPEKLQNYKTGEGEPIDSSGKRRIWNRYIVSSELADTIFRSANVEYGFKKEYTNIESAVFENKDGEKFVFINPRRSKVTTFIGDPKGIELFP